MPPKQHRTRSANGRFTTTTKATRTSSPLPPPMDPAVNPLNRVVFAQHVLKFSHQEAKRLAELARVCSTFDDTISHYGEAIFHCWRHSDETNFTQQFFLCCLHRIGATLNFVPQMLAAGASPNALGYWQQEQRWNEASPNCPVICAAAVGNYAEAVRLLADAGADVEAKTMHTERTALLLACELGKTDCVNILVVEFDADVNFHPKSIRDSPLDRACLDGHSDCACLLLAHGAELSDNTLVLAAHGGNDACVRAIIGAGAPLEFHQEGPGGVYDRFGTALASAVEGRHSRCVAELISAGAQVQDAHGGGDSPLLHTAARCGDAACLTELLKAPDVGDINAKSEGGLTALDFAAQGGHVAAVEVLVAAAGTTVEAMNGALRRAASMNCSELRVYQVLIAGGAVIDSRDAKNDMTALCDAAYDGAVAALPILLDLGADIHAVNDVGRGALSFAASQSRPDALRLLLDSGAAIGQRDKAGWPALFYAVRPPVREPWDLRKPDAIRESKIECVRVLAADSSADDLNTALLFCVLSPVEGILSLVLEAGADVNAVSEQNGRSALYWAAGKGRLEVVEALLAAGADQNVAAHDGTTALDAAREHGHQECVDALERHAREAAGAGKPRRRARSGRR